MDEKQTIQELKDYIQSFCADRDWDQFHSPKELAIGISTEAGELLDHFRFKTRDQMSAMMEDASRKEEISDELADVFFFVLRFAQKNDIDLSQAFFNKMEKNAKKYSVEEFKGSNKKYTEA
jgi:NTP pyrophosphatase (non-canonical NTP hydrolase)